MRLTTLRALTRLLPLLFAFSVSAAAPPVTVITLTSEKVANPRSYLGRIEALRQVDVMARTEGVIAKRYFRNGENVKEGQLLFEIDSAEHRAALARSQAQVNNAAAKASNAQLHLNRLQQLGAGTAVSQSELDNALAERDMARAALKEAEALLQTQRLNLAFTRITAPIGGRAGHSAIHEGALVNPARGPLVRLKQLDPVHVVIAINERDYLADWQKTLTADMQKANAAVTARLQLANGVAYPFKGKFFSVDNHIDNHTGTVAISLEFANPEHLLLPGGVVNVQLQPEAQDRLLLPAAALQQDSGGYFVLRVNHEQQVERVAIEPGAQIAQRYIVTSGLNAGDRVIVAGMQRVRPGMQVIASEAP
ncbi:efflux RND transporter periplasmic adaptor subunit [Erwinia sp. CGal63]|uniref:efflux RND transporter periplasmic adaptor subunit n=1 Tax=Erwinia sp. CGal63 TaxID=2919889 RepID=UPI00300A54B9